MIPLKDENPSNTVPVINILLIVTNISVFIQIIHIPAVIILGYWILLQILSAYAEYGSKTEAGIAWFAHIGGFIAGLALIVVMKKRGRK